MKKITMTLAFAASVLAVSALQAPGQRSAETRNVEAQGRQARACGVLQRKMAKSPTQDNWRNRIAFWTCSKGGLSPDVDTALHDGRARR